jgi:peptidoglycan/LPS O-acetylase OafA/YrhL
VTLAAQRPAIGGRASATSTGGNGPIGAHGPTGGPGPTRPARDRSIDAVRASLLVTVVAMHAMMVGVSVGAAGPVLQNALENQAWFAPVSWVLQVMPLFFVVGGFASITQWRALRAGNTTAAVYVRTRIERLVRPAVALVAVVAVALLAMTALGVPTEIVATAGFRIGQPMWFLGVYVLCSALVPLMVRAHERARVATPLVLLAAVVVVDVARLTSGIEALGFLNLLFVWVLVQQLGFWLVDGHVQALGRRTRIAVLLAALATLLALTAGPYSADMLDNLNPPTVCLVVLGVAQVMVFSLLRERIATLAERPLARAITDALGARSMTVYLWHMPVLIALAAVLLVVHAVGGVTLPEPLTVQWWATRPVWLVATALAVVPVVAFFARFERARRAPRTSRAPSPAARVAAVAAAIDTLLAAAGVATALIAGFGVLPAAVSLALLGTALLGSARVCAVLRGSALSGSVRRGSVGRGSVRRGRSQSSGWMTRASRSADVLARPVL